MYVCMYMYMYTCKRMSCIYSMSSTKAGSSCKTAHAAAGPPVSAWSTHWYPITIWARMVASHATLPASSDMKPRCQRRPKGPWEKNAFLAGKKSWLRTEGSWPVWPITGLTIRVFYRPFLFPTPRVIEYYDDVVFLFHPPHLSHRLPAPLLDNFMMIIIVVSVWIVVFMWQLSLNQ